MGVETNEQIYQGHRRSALDAADGNVDVRATPHLSLQVQPPSASLRADLDARGQYRKQVHRRATARWSTSFSRRLH